ncbi:MAG: DDE-type integrase/transposase/recombinase [Elusimicrobiota bacterium]
MEEIRLLRAENLLLRRVNNVLQEKISKSVNIRWFWWEKLSLILSLNKYANKNIRYFLQFCPVSVRTIKRWLGRFQKEGLAGLKDKLTRPSRTPQKVLPEIEIIVCRIKAENPAWGYKRISDELKKSGINYCATTIKNILKRNNMSFDFNLTRPFHQIKTEFCHQNWQIDLTIFKVFGIFPVYILGIIEDYSRVILNISVSLNRSSFWIQDTVQKTIKKWERVPLSLLTDNAKEFFSADFSSFLKRYEILHKRTPIYTPRINEKIERFFESLKKEFLSKTFIYGKKQLVKLLNEYSIYYNSYRPHQGIAGLTPIEKLKGNSTLDRYKEVKINRTIRLKKKTFAGILNSYRLVHI